MAKEALVVLNMGGPNNLDEVELFLKNMFADKNILTTKSDFLRKLIGGLIVFNRADQAQEVYKELGGKSPIVEYTKKLVAKLQDRLGDDVIVDFAMRYTPPFACDVVTRLEDKAIEKIYLLPLYPHYSTTTTKSSLEDFEECYHKAGGDALLVEVKHYFQNSHYNDVIIQRIKEQLQGDSCADFDLIFSAHGLPQKIIDNGDVYEKHIQQHVAILKERLKEEKLDFHKVHLAYQSKVGPMKWLEPSLEQKLQTVRNKGVIIYPLAFTIDNSETEYELQKEYREIANDFGFEEYRVCKCPNDDDKFVDALCEIFEKMR